jgi:hypothetical protein
VLVAAFLVLAGCRTSEKQSGRVRTPAGPRNEASASQKFVAPVNPRRDDERTAPSDATEPAAQPVDDIDSGVLGRVVLPVCAPGQARPGASCAERHDDVDVSVVPDGPANAADAHTAYPDLTGAFRLPLQAGTYVVSAVVKSQPDGECQTVHVTVPAGAYIDVTIVC